MTPKDEADLRAALKPCRVVQGLVIRKLPDGQVAVRRSGTTRIGVGPHLQAAVSDLISFKVKTA
jgi:hypothetical protein